MGMELACCNLVALDGVSLCEERAHIFDKAARYIRRKIQFFSSMTSALLVGIDLEARRHLRRLGGVTDGTGSTRCAAATSAFTFPWALWMGFTDPPAVVAARARH
jgi:hypothetical protein